MNSVSKMQLERHSAWRWLFPAGFVILVVTQGCSSNSYPASVSGFVTLDGEPINTGSVIFVSGDLQQPPGVGKIEESGRYSLSTNDRYGVPVGTYSVAVQAFKPGDLLEPGQRRFGASEPLVPIRYHDSRKSGLSFTVEPGSNTIDIALSSADSK